MSLGRPEAARGPAGGVQLALGAPAPEPGTPHGGERQAPPRSERWTSIEWSGQGETAAICTASPSLVAFLLAQAAKRPGEVRELYADRRPSPLGERWFEAPRSWLRVRPPRGWRASPVPPPDLPPVSAEERETGAAWTDGGESAALYTTDRAWIARLCRMGLRPQRPELAPGAPGWEFSFPKRWIRLRPPRRLSPEHLAALAAAGARSRFGGPKSRA